MLKTYDHRKGQDFRIETPDRAFSSLEHKFYVLDGTDCGHFSAEVLQECISKTSPRGFFVVSPWVPGADRLKEALRREFGILSEFEGTLCGYFSAQSDAPKKLLSLRQDFGGNRSGEWGIGGSFGHFANPTRRTSFKSEAWNLFHILGQPENLGCLLYMGEMEQITFSVRFFEGLDAQIKTVCCTGVHA